MKTEQDRVRLIPLEGNSFKFRCHKDIACFTKCCANLNLVLTPYDILRVKRRLRMRSDDFLNRYTEMRVDSQSRFPRIILKMDGRKGNICPFVTPGGCLIYEDRPSACRIYPLGRGALKLAEEKGTRLKFFMVREDHCAGFGEDKEWTVESWTADQGLSEYNSMNDRWSEIITSPKGLGPDTGVPRKLQMFCMASYNLDRFREFIFQSRFFEFFALPRDEKERLAEDDLSLLEFSIRWLKFSLFGERTIATKEVRSSLSGV